MRITSASELQQAGIRVFPCWTRYNPEKSKWDKGPLVPRGTSWQQAATTEPFETPPAVVGIPVPDGVVILDIDTYAGCSTAAVDLALGTQLDWDSALIQNTISGGQHYAFSTPHFTPRQLTDALGVTGFDTRTAGKGFICAGSGYEDHGITRISAPDTLPPLPESTAAHLGPPSQAVRRVQAPIPLGQDYDTLLGLLAHIDPDCSRDEWLRVGLALKAAMADQEHEAQHLFDAWSRGALSPTQECPASYVAEHIERQWPGFKTDGGIQPATLYYMAMRGGWQPPAQVDAALAFSGGARPDAYQDLARRVRRDAGDITLLDTLLGDIAASGCNQIQLALLAAELKQELTASGLKDKALHETVGRLLTPQAQAQPLAAQAGEYGKSDTDNVNVFLEKYYPNDTLALCDGRYYAYNGRVWEALTGDKLAHYLYKDMAAQYMQENRCATALRMLRKMLDNKDGGVNEGTTRFANFTNGILDTTTGVMYKHDKTLFSTCALPYAYDPHATHPRWTQFLEEAFSGDKYRISLLQEWLGYLMTPGYSIHKMMLFLGPPRAGKGLIGKVIQALVGAENFMGGSLERIAADSTLDAMSDRSVMFIGEAETRVHSQKQPGIVTTLKSVTGGDKLTWHRMYHGSVTKALPTRITMCANGVPQLFDDSGALAKRMLVLTFDKSHYGKEDVRLADKLLAEMPGIAAWSLEGLRRLREVGRFTHTEDTQDEQEYIEQTYSPASGFFMECVEITAAQDHRVTGADMYSAYKAWCLEREQHVPSRARFTSMAKDALRGTGVKYKQYALEGKTTRGFVGCQLRDDRPQPFGGAVCIT